MKIHFPLLGFNLSGGIRVIIQLANGLVKLGQETRITVPGYRADPSYPLDARVDLRILGGARTTRMAYRSLLKREAARWGDILVATGFKTPAILRASIERNHSAAKLLYLIQGYEPITHGDLSDGLWLKRKLLVWIARRSYGYADQRIYVSRFIAEKVGLDSHPAILHPGIDGEVFHPSPGLLQGGNEAPDGERAITLGIMANSARSKGFPVFLESLKRLDDLLPKMRILLLQTGPLPALPFDMEVVRAVNDHEVADYYRSLDVFVYPSLFEGFGLPPLEAMSCGIPVALSDCFGVREYIEDEVNCLASPPGDAIHLAGQIRRIMEHPLLRKKLSMNGIKTAELFTWENMTSGFHRIITNKEEASSWRNHQSQDAVS